jgi:ABC-type nitrate/sulfonate/bicarbonate transport system permease component
MIAPRTRDEATAAAGQRSPVQRLWLAWRLPLGAAVLLLAGIILFWRWAIAFWHLPPYIVPPPDAVWQVLSSQPDAYGDDLRTTLEEIVGGFVLGNGCGYCLAMLFLLSRRLALVSFPLAVGFQAVPVTTLIPLLTLIFGHGIGAILSVTVLISFFPTLLSVGRGLRSINANARDLFHLAGSTRWETVRYLAMPASLPYLFNGLRTGATACVLGATVAEWLAGSHGLGFAMVTAMTTYRIPLMWADAALAMALALAMTVLVAIVEHVLLNRDDRETL